MVRYFIAWAPIVLVVTLFVLSAPWLALFGLAFVSLASIAALAVHLVSDTEVGALNVSDDRASQAHAVPAEHRITAAFNHGGRRDKYGVVYLIPRGRQDSCRCRE